MNVAKGQKEMLDAVVNAPLSKIISSTSKKLDLSYSRHNLPNGFVPLNCRKDMGLHHIY